MNLILLAAPAAGKGTVANILNEKYNLINISAGELLRAVNPNTELGTKIREIQKSGALVDNSITNALMKERLMQNDIKSGVVLDGYPRIMEQVYALEEILKEINTKVDYVIYLKINYEEALRRTIGRRICPQCKKTYNILTGYNTPKVEDTCDECNVSLEKRNDDTEESLKVRLALFEQNTLPVIKYYKNQNKLIEIDVNRNIDLIIRDIQSSLGVKND